MDIKTSENSVDSIRNVGFKKWETLFIHQKRVGYYFKLPEIIHSIRFPIKNKPSSERSCDQGGSDQTAHIWSESSVVINFFGIKCCGEKKFHSNV